MVEIAVIEHIEDMCNETISNLLLRNMANMHAILDIVNSDCNDRYFNTYDIPIMQLSSLQQVLTNSSDNENTLQRNLACFDMVKDPVIADGDCAFRAILSQKWNDSLSLFRERFTFLGLGNNEDSDVLKLRQLFVDNVQSNDHYQMLSRIPSAELGPVARSLVSANRWLRGIKIYRFPWYLTLVSANHASSNPGLNAKTERFREPGTFSGDIGDLVIKVCSDFLRRPILVVTSINGSPYVPFIPDEPVITKPIYIAFNAYGPGHYDGTQANERYASKVC